jgi:hypothetical protein
MRLSPCRSYVPLQDNHGRPVDPEVIVDLQRDSLEKFGGFTVHPTSEGRVFQEAVVLYEVAVPESEIAVLRDVVCRLGERLGQVAMYLDTPPPSVDIIQLAWATGKAKRGGVRDVSKPSKAIGRRSKKNRTSD